MPRILVIDDEPLVRSTISTILDRAGFSVEEASDGVTGLTMFHRNPPDVVITDIFMPNGDGIEIVMEVKRSHTRTKIIAMTGGGCSGLMDIAPAAQILGADHILYKPFESEALLEAVNATLATLASPKSQHST